MNQTQIEYRSDIDTYVLTCNQCAETYPAYFCGDCAMARAGRDGLHNWTIQPVYSHSQDIPSYGYTCDVCLGAMVDAQGTNGSANDPYPYGAIDATVTADDIDIDRWHDAAEYEREEHPYDPECDCDACEQAYADAQGNDDGSTNPLFTAEFAPDPPVWNARLAARCAAIVTAAGGLALALACETGTPASAHEIPLVPTDGECVLTRTFEDGSATALCGPSDAWAYDSDGGYIVDNGIVFFYRAPGTWYQVN